MIFFSWTDFLDGFSSLPRLWYDIVEVIEVGTSFLKVVKCLLRHINSLSPLFFYFPELVLRISNSYIRFVKGHSCLVSKLSGSLLLDGTYCLVCWGFLMQNGDLA